MSKEKEMKNKTNSTAGIKNEISQALETNADFESQKIKI